MAITVNSKKKQVKKKRRNKHGGFNDQLARMQEELAGSLNAATDRFYESRRDTAGQSGAGGAPVVQQTVNFYEPVESPSQVARRMEDVNDQLGMMMA